MCAASSLVRNAGRPPLRRACASLVLAAVLLGAGPASAVAQDRWSAARPPDASADGPSSGRAAPPFAGAPPAGAYAEPPPWQSPPGGTVERGELGPVMAGDTSGLPFELWQGLDLAALEGLLAGLELPPRSPGLHRLWRRILKAAAAPPAGVPSAEHFIALRLEALYRSGLLDDMAELLDANARSGAVVNIIAARREIGLGRRQAGCEKISALSSPSSGLPERLTGESQLLSGYCAAAAGDAAGAGLAVELAREEGFDAALPLSVLTGIATRTKPRVELPGRALLLDYRFLELLGPPDAFALLDRAEPALLVVLARDPQADARLKLAATEAAVRVHALSADALADAYRQAAAGAAEDAADPPLRRAMLFRALELARTSGERARLMRALVEEGRRSAMGDALERLVAPQLAALEPASEPDFAATATEIALAAGDFARARAWASALPLWQDLIAIVEPQDRRPAPRLAATEALAAAGRIGPEALHRLVTVLDALDYDVPIALWDAANRTPQPADGYLPDTGVLGELADAVKRREVGRSVLLVMRALGPNGPQGTHVIALRDGVRALQRVGLAADARRLALEALLPVWPRAGN